MHNSQCIIYNGKISINEVKTKYLFKIVNGATPSSSNIEYWDGNITWITPADMSKCISNTIMNSDRKITKEGLSSCGTSLVPTGSIILSTRAPIGSVCIAGVELCTNQGCKALVAKDNINERFYFYYLLISTELLNSLGRGTTFLELSGSDLGNFLLPFPKKAKQDEIANYLDQKCAEIDRIIAAKQKQNERLKEYKQSIIYEAVTKGLDKNVKYKDSGIEWIGEIPEKWKICKIKYIAHLKSGVSINSSMIQQEGDYPVYGGNGLRGYTNSFTHDGKYSLIGRQGALCGNVHLVEGKFWASEHAVVVTINDGNDISWFNYILISMNLNQYSESAAQPGISVERIENLLIPILIGGIKMQQHIADYLDQKCGEIDRIIKSNDDMLAKLKEYRQSIIYEAVTGKIEM